MKCLVTGGSGFIGSHIVDILIENKYEVVVVDKNLRNTNPKAKYYEQDITDYKALEKIFKNEEPELVSHNAAHVSVPESVRDPSFDAMNNIIGTINTAKLAKESKAKNFVFSSSSAVYGNTDSLKFINESSDLQPISPYGVSKEACEKYIQVILNNYIILRYGNVYGPRQAFSNEGSVISTFIKRMKQKGPVTIYGDGNQVRDYVYVKDVAQANLRALQLRSRKIMNVGTGKATSVNEIFDMIKKLTGYKLKAERENPREADIYRSVLDNSRLLKELNYIPQTGIEKGLEMTVPMF